MTLFGAHALVLQDQLKIFDDEGDCALNKLDPSKPMQGLIVFKVQQAANMQKVVDLPEIAVLI